MASLLEIANVARTIPIQGLDVDVFGISAEGVATIMARFPEVGKMFSGVMPDSATLMKMAPDALAAFIAAGCGKINDPGMEAVAAKLGVSDQLDLVDEIMRLTFPRGIGPFVLKLQALGLLAQVDPTALQQLSPDTPKSSSQQGT